MLTSSALQEKWSKMMRKSWKKERYSEFISMRGWRTIHQNCTFLPRIWSIVSIILNNTIFSNNFDTVALIVALCRSAIPPPLPVVIGEFTKVYPARVRDLAILRSLSLSDKHASVIPRISKSHSTRKRFVLNSFCLVDVCLGATADCSQTRYS